MKNRSVVGVLLLTIVTLGIYSVYWQVSTKIEMNKRGATIPTAWLILVPLVNIWWLWKYCEGVDKETNGTYSTVIAFILLFLLGVIGMMIIQHEFNKGAAPTAAEAVGTALAEPVAPVAPEAPTQFAAPAETTPFAQQPTTPVATEATPLPENTPPSGPISS